MKVTRGFINLISLGYVVIIVVAAIVAFYLASPGAVSEIGKENLKDGPNAALTISNDMVKQLVTLGTGLIGFCLWLFRRPIGGDPGELVERYLWTALAMLLLAASLYFGFVALQRTLIVVAWGSFDPRLQVIWWPQFLQFYLFVFGAATLGFACIRSLNTIVEKP